MESKPIVGMIWDLFLTVMIGYFLFSIVSGLIQEKAIEIRDSEHGEERKKTPNHNWKDKDFVESYSYIFMNKKINLFQSVIDH